MSNHLNKQARAAQKAHGINFRQCREILLIESRERFDKLKTIKAWHVGLKPGPIVYDQNGNQIADCRSPSNTPEENKFNARLIAAAPLLLAACKRALPYLADHVAMTPDQGPGDRLAHDEVEAAIALCEKEGS
jgi:hypothetical protein